MSSYAENMQDLLEQDNKLGFVANIIFYIARFLSAPVLVLLRRNFGERAFSFTNVVIQVFIISAAGGGVGAISTSVAGFSGVGGLLGIGINAVQFAQITAGVILLLGIYHKLKIMGRTSRGERWHSRYEGDSWALFTVLPFGSSGFVVGVIYEPAFVFLLSGFVVAINPLLGVWLLLASFSMTMLSRFSFSAARDAYLNVVDAQIEAEQMQATLEGEPPANTEGFVVRGVSDTSPKRRVTMVGMLGGEAKMPEPLAEKTDVAYWAAEAKQANTVSGASTINEPSPQGA